MVDALGSPVISGNFIRNPEQAKPHAASGSGYVAELTVVVPTYNERDNVEALLARLEVVLAGIAWEVIYVDDDSADGTAAVVHRVAQSDPRVRCLHRIGRRGLSSAVIEGMLASSAPYLAVIDADLQHDETLLPQMLAAMKAEDLDIVIGSRYIMGAAPALGTSAVSQLAISRLALPGSSSPTSCPIR